MTARVLIATRSFGSTSRAPWDALTESGLEAVPVDMARPMTEERLSALLADDGGVDAAIVGVVPLTARVLASAPRLKVICMHGVGVDHIDLEAARRCGIVVANCPGTNAEAVADLALGLMIALARQLPLLDGQVRAGGWGTHRGVELWSKTLGLVGLGHIGRAVARRARGFDMKVLGYDPYVDADAAAAAGIEPAPLEELLARADFVSLHTALTPQTRGLIGAAQLATMRPTAYLINTARGGVVDEDALYQALCSGAPAGAALDAFAQEPPCDSPLLTLPNVILTPHIGAHTAEAIARVGLLAVQNVAHVLRTGEPLHRVA